jgi:hypothetical protein
MLKTPSLRNVHDASLSEEKEHDDCMSEVENCKYNLFQDVKSGRDYVDKNLIFCSCND